MGRLLYISVFAILFGCGLNICAQERTGSDAVMKQLLAAPAPTPRNGETSETQKVRPPNFFDSDNHPPDDAPIDDLIDYWIGRSNPLYKGGPSNTVRQRLLDWSGDDLKKLSPLLPLFTASETFAERIKQAFDKGANDPELKYQRQEIKKWLVFNSTYFLGELLSLASKANDNSKSAFIENETALKALTKVDWSAAKPLLETLVNSGQQGTSTLALTLLYRHSVDEKDTSAELKFRSQLQSIASDRSFRGRARDDAIEALSQTEWSGRDEWYLSLFSDESLIELRDEGHAFSPLGTLFTRDPDKWIPVMTKLVTGKDQIPQQAAASCLARHATWSHRRDAILPVLRWLTDPDWIPLGSTQRAWFIQAMDEVDIPESVPGLIWIVENENDFSRRYAAGTLARYKDPRAIPALKKALAESDEDDRPLILEGLLASGGLTETEQVDALEAFAAKKITEAGPEEVMRYRSYRDEPLPIPVSTGFYLARLNSPPEGLAKAVFTRAESIGKRDEPLRRALLEIAHRWQGQQIDADLVKRIAANTAEAETIIVALNRRTSLRESVKSELHSLIAARGVPQGIGAILLDDSGINGSILTSTDQAAQVALLACARLTQTSLPVGLVRPLLKSKNSLLANAAEKYLLAEDSKEARTLLWQHHRNQAFITGWRENIELIGRNFDEMGKLEEKLRAELFKPDGPREIFSLFSNGNRLGRVLRIYADRATYTHYEDSSRYREREVSKAEIANFKQFVSTNGLDDRGPRFGPCHHNCAALEFLTLTRERGRRAFSHEGIERSAIIVENFDLLGRGNETRTHYNFEKDIKGLEVLFSDEGLAVSDVWQRGEEIRIFVERAETMEERAANNAEDEANDNARVDAWQRERARSRARLSWRSLKNKDASSVTTAPEGYAIIDDARFPLDENDEYGRRDERQVQILTSDSILIARNFKGLWKQVAGTKAARISRDDGGYANPVVTPDGKWAVLSRTDSDWSSPNYLLRINLETGQEFRVKLEPADQLDAIVFLPVHSKILLRRAKDDPDLLSGKLTLPSVGEHYLLDPKTGEVQSISGEFVPLHQEGKRFLQPTSKPGEYWAAIPDRTKNQTQVGRYNLKDFSFTPVLTLPQISFESMSMWVDEKREKLYFVYRAQLMRLPLKQAVASK